MAVCESQRITDLEKVIVGHDRSFRTICMALISPSKKSWSLTTDVYIEEVCSVCLHQRYQSGIHSFPGYREWMVSSTASFSILELASLLLRFSTRSNKWYISNNSRRFSANNAELNIIDMFSLSFSLKAFWAGPSCVLSHLGTWIV